MKIVSNLIISGSAILDNGAIILTPLSGSGSFTGSLNNDKIGIYYDAGDSNLKVVNQFGSLGTLQLTPGLTKYSVIIGDGINNIFVINHNLNTRNLMVSVRENIPPYETVYPTVLFQDNNNMSILFGQDIPVEDQYTVTYI